MKRIRDFDLEPLKAASLELATSHCGLAFDRSGRALCPVHDDNRPSLTYWPKGRLFKCWSCGFSSDIVGLYQRVARVGFLQAAAALGARPLPINRRYAAPLNDARRQRDAVVATEFRILAGARDVLRAKADDESLDLPTRLAAMVGVHDLEQAMDAIVDRDERAIELLIGELPL